MPYVRPPRRSVLMVTHSYYEEDSRVRREAEALRDTGRGVDVIALRRPGLPAREVVAGVDVHRLPIQRRQGGGIGRYLLEYTSFFWRAAFVAARLHRRRRYGLVQVHTLPDPLVFAVAPLKAAGTPVLLDLHEAMPPFFRSRFPGASNLTVQGVLEAAEHASIAFADHALTVNEALAERLVRLGVPASKVTVVLNSPSRSLFEPHRLDLRPFMADGILRLVYAGALTPLYQVGVAIEAIALLRDGRAGLAPAPWPVTLDIFGRGDAQPALEELVGRLALADRVRFHGRIPLDEVPARIAAADAGLAPTRRDAYTDLSLSTKVFECAAMLRPVLASRLPTVERYFGRHGLFYFEPGDAVSLATAMRRLVEEPARRAEVVAHAAARVAELSWERQSARYVALVDSLARD
jgi:glycosyltransferase involved in cell wall biosynthesis